MISASWIHCPPVRRFHLIAHLRKHAARMPRTRCPDPKNFSQPHSFFARNFPSAPTPLLVHVVSLPSGVGCWGLGPPTSSIIHRQQLRLLRAPSTALQAVARTDPGPLGHPQRRVHRARSWRYATNARRRPSVPRLGRFPRSRCWRPTGHAIPGPALVECNPGGAGGGAEAVCRAPKPSNTGPQKNLRVVNRIAVSRETP